MTIKDSQQSEEFAIKNDGRAQPIRFLTKDGMHVFAYQEWSEIPDKDWGIGKLAFHVWVSWLYYKAKMMISEVSQGHTWGRWWIVIVTAKTGTRSLRREQRNNIRVESCCQAASANEICAGYRSTTLHQKLRRSNTEYLRDDCTNEIESCVN